MENKMYAIRHRCFLYLSTYKFTKKSLPSKSLLTKIQKSENPILILQ